MTGPAGEVQAVPAVWAVNDRVRMLDSGITVRPFRPSDQLEAKELILAGLHEHWGTRDPSRNQDLEDIGASYADARFLVACDDERIVGTGALIPREEGIAEIIRMSVAATFRRRGIGRRILDELLRHAEHLDVRTIVLETTQTWDGAIRFYLTHGFEITHYANGDVYFARRLQGTASEER